MAEPVSSPITSEELATRVRRVVGRRFRRDAAARLEPTTPEISAKTRNWTNLAYDYVMITLAIFLVCILVLNLSIAGSWRERGNQWNDRVRWQRELNAWEQQLVKQEQRLTAQCQQLAASLIARPGPADQQQTFDRVNELRQRLREANQSLIALLGTANNTPNNLAVNANETPALSTTALRTQREQLIEQQYAARNQFQAGHPTLQTIEQQLAELERQLAISEAANRANNSTDSESRVQVIENQFLRTASNSPRSAPPVETLPPAASAVEQRFEQLRSATEGFLRDIDSQDLTLRQEDALRAEAWEQVAAGLRSMAQACAIPAVLKQTIDKQTELRAEPALSPTSLVLCFVVAAGVAGGVVWRASFVAAIQNFAPTNTRNDEQLSVSLVTQQLGCAPGAVVPWDLPPSEAAIVTDTTPSTITTPALQQKMRFASECLLAVTIAATVLLAMTHAQFGEWLIANPLTAWGRWLGS